MSQIKYISIPKPCHERWAAMAPVSGGRYCQACCKTVIDFTAMTDDKIIAHLSSKNNVCGRLQDYQLRSINANLSINNQPVLHRWGLVVLMTSFLPFIGVNVKAQICHRPYNTTLKSAPTLLSDARTMHTILGYVKGENGEALPGATVFVEGAGIKTFTNVNGSFSINVPENTDTIKVAFIGYSSQRIAITQQSDTINVVLVEDKLFENNVSVIAGGIVIMRPFLWRIWYNIRKPFRSIF